MAVAITRHVTDDELAAMRPLVTKIIGGLRHRGTLQAHHETDDLHSVGMTAAWLALTVWDSDRGANEKTYVTIRITGAILDYQRQDAKAHGYTRLHGRLAIIDSIDEPVPTADGDVSLADTLADPADIAEHGEARAELSNIIHTVRNLPFNLRTVVAGIAADQTQREIGDRLGVCESRITQLGRDLVDQINRSLCAPQSGTLLIDRTIHPSREQAEQAAQQVRPGCTVWKAHKRKVRAGRIVSPQGRPTKDGSLGRPVWALEITA